MAVFIQFTKIIITLVNSNVMTKKLLVLGGSGFVGKAICRESIQRGWTVTSLNRSGAPTNVAVDPLLSKVQWSSGDALDSSLYPALLASHDYVIHSIGILFESSNPFQKSSVNYSRSYRALIRDSTEIALKESAKAGVRAFGYISAARFGAFGSAILPEYMRMKAEAEALVMASNVRTVTVRPSFIYGADRPMTIPIAYGVRIMSLFTAGLFPKPIAVETVARAVLNEISREADSNNPVILEGEDLSRVAAEISTYSVH